MHTLEFLRQTPADQPFYAHISYVKPHRPFCAPADYTVGLIRRFYPLLFLPNRVRIQMPLATSVIKTPAQPNWQLIRRHYFADLMDLDHQLGRVMETLEQQRDCNTYLVFLADHGELLGDHGFTSKEERHYDACIRVPLIIAGPGIQQGTIYHQPVQLEDICPTILDMTNLRFPAMPKMGSYLKVEADQIPRLLGRSMLPLCQENTTVTGWRQAAYSGSCNASWSIGPGNWAQTIRTDRYRYTIYPGQGGQLFDLQNDPDEQHNLVAEADFADIRQQLQYQLMELIIGLSYPKTRRSLFALGVH